MALPIHLAGTHWERLHPPLLEAGTYAVDPDPWGPPWRLWDEVGEREAAERGYYLPRYSVPYGPAGNLVLTPGDTRGTVFLPDRLDGYCMGIDGRAGPNLACAGCGREVGYRIDDCGHWQVVRLLAGAVRRLPGPQERPVLEWEDLFEDGVLWTRPADYRDIPAGVALAHVVAASGGRPVMPAPGRVARLLGRAIETRLPTGDGGLRLDLAGPGIAEPDAELLLVPVHPQTGEVWQPRGPGLAVPVEAALWAELAAPAGWSRRPWPVLGRLPAGWEPDDLVPDVPVGAVLPSGEAYIGTLERLPVAREPWLRELLRIT
ncbi:hypothetical protein ACGFX4_03390 [Kitasatospora sp. NPDC048365]|uniref:hypothetical protein n=1 Tax=Kitasatospora sp. NPDC048365 TaxID=3364050 RepID=UPI00371152F8